MRSLSSCKGKAKDIKETQSNQKQAKRSCKERSKYGKIMQILYKYEYATLSSLMF